MSSKVDPEILGGFVREVESHLPRLAKSLAECRAGCGNTEALEAALRAAQCIRHAGATVGLAALSRLAQYPEDACEQLLNGELAWSDRVAATLESAARRIAEYLRGMLAGTLEEEHIVADMVRSFRRMRGLPEQGDEDEIRRVLEEEREAGERPISGVEESGVFEASDLEPEEPQFETFGEAEAGAAFGEAAFESLEEPEALECRAEIEPEALPGAEAVGPSDFGLPEAQPQEGQPCSMAIEGVSEMETGDLPEPEAVGADWNEEPRALQDAAATGGGLMQTIDEVRADEDLWNAFLEETAELFERIAESLAVLESGANPEALKTVRRAFHQIKGAAGVVGMLATSRLCGYVQKVLDPISEQQARWYPELHGLLQATFDVVLEAIGGRGTGARLADRAAALEAQWAEAIAQAQAAARAEPQQEETPASTSLAGMPEDRIEGGEDLWEAFHQEAEEHLHHIGELLRRFEKHGPEPEKLQSLRRSVHTLKGACGVVGMRLTSSVAHRMEDLLDALWEGRLEFGGETASLLLATFDILTDAVGARGLSAENREKLPALFERYEEALARAGAQAATPQAAEEPPVVAEAQQQAPVEAQELEADQAQARKIVQFVRAPIERLDELVRLVTELVIHRSRFEQYLSAYRHEVDELQLSVERLGRISRKLQSDYEAAALQEANRRMSFASTLGRGSAGAAEDFDSLEFDRYTEFHLLSRDLAETSGDIASTSGRLDDLIADFDGFLNRLGRLTTDVEDRLMRLRMVPLRHISSRLHRTVRVTAERSGKLVDLVIEGESVELDKTVLEEMAGPLDHILRNAVDHGIEPAAERVAAGKSERGTIVLKAYYEGTQVVLQIKDDGAGLSLERLRRSAVRMGYVAEEEAANLSDQELYNLIFVPGFSTASELSEVSGRGVGLDVVKATVSNMKGTLSVSSEPGRGAVFTIRLPITVALTRVVLVKSGGETFAIPLSAVTQVLRVEPEQFERVGRKPVLRLGEKLIPTMHVSEFLGNPPPRETNLARLKAVILNIGDQSLAVMVDQVLEAREVVVKSLGALLGRVHGVTGATLMGDGSIVLILNPNDMLHYQHALAPQARLRAVAAPAAKSESEVYEVLIVDDSPTVRRVLSTLISNAGWKAHVAKDGIEALERIHASTARPDVFLLDIEMPRMDGYELTATLRAMHQFRHTPIIMLTSRAGEKHRRKAFELGVTEYMIKPYQDDELLSTVRRVVGEARAAVRT